MRTTVPMPIYMLVLYPSRRNEHGERESQAARCISPVARRRARRHLGSARHPALPGAQSRTAHPVGAARCDRPSGRVRNRRRAVRCAARSVRRCRARASRRDRVWLAGRGTMSQIRGADPRRPQANGFRRRRNEQRPAGGRPLRTSTCRSLGSSTPYKAVIIAPPSNTLTTRLRCSSTTSGLGSTNAKARRLKRAAAMSATAASPWPATSPIATPNFPSGSATTAYQSPPISVPVSAAR